MAAGRSASSILADPAVQQRRAAMRAPAGGMGMQAPMGAGGQPQMMTPGMGAMGGAGAQRPGAMGMPMAGGPQMPGSAPGGMRMAGLGGGQPQMPGMPQPGGGMQTAAITGGRGGTPMPNPAPGGGPTQTVRPSPQPAPSYPGGGDGAPYGGGTDPYGQPYDRKGKKKFKGAPWLKKASKKLPPWMQDQGMYQDTMSQIQELLGGQGHLSPEKLIMEQAGIQQGGQQSQQALAARMGQYGIDPSSPQAMSMAGSVDQSTNRLMANQRRQEDIDAYGRQVSNLNLPIPYLQAMLGMTTKHGGGGVQALPQNTGGGGGPDYYGMASSAGNALLSNYQNMPWAK